MSCRLMVMILILVACVAPARSESRRYILQAPGGLNVVQTLCSLIGCDPLLQGSTTLIQGLGDPLGQLFVISTSNNSFLFELLDLLGITHLERDLLINLLGPLDLITPSTPAPAGLSDSAPVSFYGSTVWNGYAAQPAADIIRLGAAQIRFNVQGAGTIGIIDTGVDPNHPALVPALVPGYDFTRNQAGGSEMADITESTVAVVDGGATPMQVNGTTIAVLSESTVAVVDPKDPSHGAFGHGTMVAGIVHLVAPTSRIMPLKAFHADGTGYASDIVRAIYFAVQNNVDALNMSFSMTSRSSALQNALNYAVQHGVVSAAAAGNQGRDMTVYPATWSNDVMDVASTSMTDTRSSFSNYGDDVWVAAPGEGIITTYPTGTYAAGWGTSFSAPFVTGTVGLMLQMQSGINEKNAASAVGHARNVGQNLGQGRLDVMRAISALRGD